MSFRHDIPSFPGRLPYHNLTLEIMKLFSDFNHIKIHLLTKSGNSTSLERPHNGETSRLSARRTPSIRRNGPRVTRLLQSNHCRNIAITVRRDNRHEAENGKFLRGRSSDPLGPKFCVGYREVHSEA
jgi:hypothetical protein